MIYNFIFFTLLSIICILGGINGSRFGDDGIIRSSTFCFSFVLTIILCMVVDTHIDSNKNIMKPIDVYRGNTDIEVTYTIKSGDTINCDTTVVWKN